MPKKKKKKAKKKTKKKAKKKKKKKKRQIDNYLTLNPLFWGAYPLLKIFIIFRNLNIYQLYILYAKPI